MITQITLEKLEFQKVLNQVSNYSITEKGKQLVQNIKPVTDKKFISREGETVNQAKGKFLSKMFRLQLNSSQILQKPSYKVKLKDQF